MLLHIYDCEYERGAKVVIDRIYSQLGRGEMLQLDVLLKIDLRKKK